MAATKRARVKRGARALTPSEAALELARVLDQAAAPLAAPLADPVPLDDLADADLVRQVESRKAQQWGDQVATWLDAMLAGTPQRLVDAEGRAVVGTWLADVLPAWMECEWLARITWPELYEDRPDVVPPRTAADALAHGLSIVRPRRRRGRLRTPTLPGCKGGFLAGQGHDCPNLRVTGHEFCPECEAVLEWSPR